MVFLGLPFGSLQNIWPIASELGKHPFGPRERLELEMCQGRSFCGEPSVVVKGGLHLSFSIQVVNKKSNGRRE